ncbi:MAG TPA: cellulase family glycosylhydrolase [Kofleriaceae bacterium]|nr:cellulase family glycosylhydrolase [Kofleriaceae bacterium]
MTRLALLAVVAACGSSPRETRPLSSDGTHLRDDSGRIALLRGVNARASGIFDVTFDDGRIPLEPIPALEAADCKRMRELGLDLLRLPINWSGIEPTRGSYDEAYLQRVDAAVRCAGDAGVYVMIDLHQDAYSKEIGEDGAPLWAIEPPPTMLLQGPLTDLGDRRTSAQVTAAFETFFDQDDPKGLQAAFFAMLDHVAARWADDPAVIGFELFNEPSVGQVDVDPFNDKAAARVRAAAPDKLVFFEPSATRNLFDFAPKPPGAFSVENSVYAPHIYTFVFYSDRTRLEQLVPADLEPSVAAAREEANVWQTPLVIGEYGIGPTDTNADLWMGVQAELHDRYLASDAFWVWKEDSQASWGVFDHTGGVWTERPQVVAWLSRVHAARIAGEVVANEYDHVTRTLHLETHSSAAHAIYVPAPGFTATCNGTQLSGERDPATGLVELACDGMLVVAP